MEIPETLTPGRHEYFSCHIKNGKIHVLTSAGTLVLDRQDFAGHPFIENTFRQRVDIMTDSGQTYVAVDDEKIITIVAPYNDTICMKMSLGLLAT